MAFFVFIFAAALVAAGVQFAAGSGIDVSTAMRWGMAAGLLFFGADHWLKPGRYLPMMPRFVPYPRAVVLFTGLCEIAGGIGLLIPGLRLLAGFMLAVYFVCVFPANIKTRWRVLRLKDCRETAGIIGFACRFSRWRSAGCSIVRVPGTTWLTFGRGEQADRSAAGPKCPPSRLFPPFRG